MNGLDLLTDLTKNDTPILPLHHPYHLKILGDNDSQTKLEVMFNDLGNTFKYSYLGIPDIGRCHGLIRNNRLWVKIDDIKFGIHYNPEAGWYINIVNDLDRTKDVDYIRLHRSEVRGKIKNYLIRQMKSLYT